MVCNKMMLIVSERALGWKKRMPALLTGTVQMREKATLNGQSCDSSAGQTWHYLVYSISARANIYYLDILCKYFFHKSVCSTLVRILSLIPFSCMHKAEGCRKLIENKVDKSREGIKVFGRSWQGTGAKP